MRRLMRYLGELFGSFACGYDVAKSRGNTVPY